jgi:pyridoxine kinase
MHILSIQSSVAYGHVGNAAAVFPLQRLGAEVTAINTVAFSNHPGYGAFTGDIVKPETVQALLNGVAARGALTTCDALLSGYLGDAATGAVILDAATRLRSANPKALWCCDPVIGDDAPGIYVRPGVAEFFRNQAVPAADLLTPNRFELACLTGLPCDTLADVRSALCAVRSAMRAAGPRAVLVTSVHTQDTPGEAIDCLAAGREGVFRLRTPKLPITVNGAGDAMAALFLFHVLATGDVRQALEKSAASIHGLVSRTSLAGSRELLIAAAQNEFVCPASHFAAHKV